MCNVINIITVVIICLLFLKERKDREIGGWVVLCGVAVLKYEECVSLGGASVQSSFLTSHQTHTLTLEQSLNININITV